MSINLKKLNLTFVFTTFFIFCCNYSVFAKDESYLLQPGTHSVLSKAHEDMENGKNTEALKKLNKLILSGRLKDYDAAIVYQTMGYTENNLGNFTSAAKYFIKSLSLEALPQKVSHDLYFHTAQLLLHIEKPKEGLKYLSKWFAHESSPKAEAHILAATAYYYLEDYKQLIVHVEKALLLSSKPPLTWHELLLAAYYETKNYKNAALILEKIITQYPDKTDYWVQLAGIYQHLEKDKQALALYELAYTKGLLKKETIVQLVKNYLYLGMPYKAATVLEKEMAVGDIEANKEMLNLLVNSWILAQENNKAKSVFREIISKFDDDKTRLRLAQLFIESEEWNEIIKTLDVKFVSNDEALLSKVNLLLGIAQYHSDDLSKATRAFTQALSDKSTADQAKWWLEHLKKKSTAKQQS